MRTILNIGLSSNTLKVVDIISVMNRWYGIKQLKTLSIDDGMYNGAIEPTLVISYRCEILDDDMVKLLLMMSQTCLAVKSGRKGRLIYTPEHTGDKITFDNEIFITP